MLSNVPRRDIVLKACLFLLGLFNALMPTQVWDMQILPSLHWGRATVYECVCLFIFRTTAEGIRELAAAVIFRRRFHRRTQIHKRCPLMKRTHTHTQQRLSRMLPHHRHEARAQVDLMQAVLGSPSHSKRTLPACRAVSQESLIMKAKIFYSDLLIWKWSVPVGRGTALLNLSSVSRGALTSPYICLVVFDSQILPGASPSGITQGFFERNKTHSDKEQPLY